jgi:acetyltransferase-like isoleucine patch superfamily enzyme
VEVSRCVQGRLEIGERAQVGDGVRLGLLGGSITLGDDVEFRRGGVVDARGTFVLHGPALVSYGVVVHCAERITVAPGCGIAEYVTLVDSAHFHTDDGTWFLDNVKAAPITIGRAVWIGAKATVLRGVTLGDDCIVSANALVVRDVPAKAVVSGVPAEPVVRRPAGEQS